MFNISSKDVLIKLKQGYLCSVNLIGLPSNKEWQVKKNATVFNYLTNEYVLSSGNGSLNIEF